MNNVLMCKCANVCSEFEALWKETFARVNNLHICIFAHLHITFMNDQKDKLPLFKSWTHWYVLVLGFLIVLILLFYWLTKTFA